MYQERLDIYIKLQRRCSSPFFVFLPSTVTVKFQEHPQAVQTKQEAWVFLLFKPASLTTGCVHRSLGADVYAALYRSKVRSKAVHKYLQKLLKRKHK